MLDKNDLQAIAELITASEERMTEKIHAAISASEERMTAAIDEKISASEERMKRYIYEKVTDETNRSIAYTEDVVRPELALLKEGIDLSLETPRIPVERFERIEENITVLKIVVREHSEDIEYLKKAQ